MLLLLLDIALLSTVINFLLLDIDECALKTDDCSKELATCTNTVGSYLCQCIDGYTGSGVVCTGIIVIHVVLQSNSHWWRV